MVIKEKDYTHVSILVVGAGPGGLAAAIAARSANKDASVVVLEKGEAIGNHTLSGAVLEAASLKRLLDEASPDWLCIEGAEHIMGREVRNDEVRFLRGKKSAINVSPLIRLGKKWRLSFGEMDNSGDYIVSISKLTRFLGKIASSLGIEVYTGFGVKETIRVSKERYELFGNNRVVHTMDYPLWLPIMGPNIFGGGFVYSYGDNQIAVGIIAGADWRYCNFNPQKALEDFKRHAFLRQFIEGGEVIEAGVKMIPEGGYYAIPRHIQLSTNGKTISTIGYKNVIIVGDSAGFVNMHKIKGIHNAIESGSLAGKASIQCLKNPNKAAEVYTDMIEHHSVMSEMKSARNFRTVISKFGSTIGFPLAVIGKYLPKFNIEKDYKATTPAMFKFGTPGKFDKTTFVALAGTKHREDQPPHLRILDQNFCINKCNPLFDRPCITFCPAGVYGQVGNDTVPAKPLKLYPLQDVSEKVSV